MAALPDASDHPQTGAPAQHEQTSEGPGVFAADAGAHLPRHIQPLPQSVGELAARTAGSGGTQESGGTLLSLRTTRRRRTHADRQSATLLPSQNGAHDLRIVALLMHAEHDVDWVDGERYREISRPSLRTNRSEGRCRSARAFAVPDDPH